MVLPILTYGQPVLRQRAEDVPGDSPELQTLIDDMIDTMHGASGIGLAAPQIGTSMRLFVVDLSALAEDLEEEYGEVPEWATGPMAIINPEILPDTESEHVDFEEGCLSIPDIREVVIRPDLVLLRYLDRSFIEHSVDAEGMLARVVQHEFDHLNGVLFVDHISALRKRLLQRRLKAMARGEVEAEYPIEVVG